METSKNIYEQLGITYDCYSYVTPVHRVNLFGFDKVIFTVDFADMDCFTKADIDEFCKNFDVTFIETQRVVINGVKTSLSYCMQDTFQFVENYNA